MIEWLSGGATQYHTLWACLRHDTYWVTALALLKVGIVLLYLVVAARSWAWSAAAKNSTGRRVFRFHIAVFVLCAVSGYLFDVVALWWNAARLEVFAHAALLVATAVYLHYSWYTGIEIFTPKERLTDIADRLGETTS